MIQMNVLQGVDLSVGWEYSKYIHFQRSLVLSISDCSWAHGRHRYVVTKNVLYAIIARLCGYNII